MVYRTIRIFLEKMSTGYIRCKVDCGCWEVKFAEIAITLDLYVDPSVASTLSSEAKCYQAIWLLIVGLSFNSSIKVWNSSHDGRGKIPENHERKEKGARRERKLRHKYPTSVGARGAFLWRKGSNAMNLNVTIKKHRNTLTRQVKSAEQCSCNINVGDAFQSTASVACISVVC